MDIPELIGEVAKKHNVLLGKNDPILLTVFLNERVLSEHVAQVAKAAELANKEAERRAMARIDKARDAAKLIVDDAAKCAGKEVVETVQKMMPELESILFEAIKRSSAAAGEARKHRNVSLVAAAVSVVSMVALIAFLVRGHC
jgi:vacuolar-type H+-ATPase subunit H